MERDPQAAMSATLAQIGTGEAPVKITCTFTDGETLYGFRHASIGAAPTLYASPRLDNGGRAFASEPLDGGRWDEVRPDRVIALSAAPMAQVA